MPNRADVELLNNAITEMGQSFAQSRKESADQDYRQQLLDREIEREKSSEAHYGAEQTHYKAMEDKQDQILQNAQVQNAIKTHNDQYDKLLSALEKGQIDENQFNQSAQSVVDNTYDATHTILNNTAFAPWAAKKGFQMKRGQPAMQLTPAKIGNRDAAIGPKGSVHFTDEFSPQDKMDLNDINTQLRSIDQQTVKMADNPNPSQARTLNIQRQQLQARKTAIQQKYQQPQTPTSDAGSQPTAAPNAAPGPPSPTTASAGQPSAAAPPANKVLDANTARMYLQKAGGDKNKARQMATQDGYTIQ